MVRQTSLAICLLVVAFGVGAWAADDELSPPAHKASLVCFNGKDGSESNCRSSMAKIEGGLRVVTSKVTCGFKGAVSEITWTYRGQKDGKDQYHITRKFPSDTEQVRTFETDLSFNGTRSVLFQDEAQCIVVEVQPSKK